MIYRYFWACFALNFFVFLSWSSGQETVSQTGDSQKGKLLFEKVWVSENESNKPSRSDQLGPLFNANSCVACHHQNGVGGAGGNESNAHLLSIFPAKNRRGKFDLSGNALEKMFKEGAKIHQNLGDANGMVLHKFSAVGDFQKWREDVIWGKPTPALTQRREPTLLSKPIHRIQKSRNFMVQVSQRNTPSLFGAGLIETISRKDLAEIANQQLASKNSKIRGQIARLADGNAGKFGWRGQKASVEEFTVEACAVELGLKTQDSFASELPNSLKLPEGYKPGFADDMSNEQVDDMVAFVRDLPPPLEQLPDTESGLEGYMRGKKIFAKLNCGACHVKKVGDVDGVYSDFLMHDMGPVLADAAGVIRRQEIVERFGGGSIGGYFGPSTPSRSKSRTVFNVGNDRFWQTPPLWGIRDTAPYLHDGSAKDYHQAIALHGGEASDSIKAYKRLPRSYRRYLFDYLDTLGYIEPKIEPEVVSTVEPKIEPEIESEVEPEIFTDYVIEGSSTATNLVVENERLFIGGGFLALIPDAGKEVEQHREPEAYDFVGESSAVCTHQQDPVPGPIQDEE